MHLHDYHDYYHQTNLSLVLPQMHAAYTRAVVTVYSTTQADVDVHLLITLQGVMADEGEHLVRTARRRKASVLLPTADQAQHAQQAQQVQHTQQDAVAADADDVVRAARRRKASLLLPSADQAQRAKQEQQHVTFQEMIVAGTAVDSPVQVELQLFVCWRLLLKQRLLWCSLITTTSHAGVIHLTQVLYVNLRQSAAFTQQVPKIRCKQCWMVAGAGQHSLNFVCIPCAVAGAS